MSRVVSVDRIDPSPWADLCPPTEGHVARLLEDIEARGVQRPLHVFPHGDRYELLGGHARLEAAKRAGKVEVPIVTRSMLSTDDERFEYFCKDNMHEPKDPRALAREGLLRWTGLSNREIARKVGVNHETVRTVRMAMEEAGELTTVVSSIGTDGKRRPAHKPRQVIPINRPKPEPRPDPVKQMRAMREAGAQSAVFADPAPADDVADAIADRIPEVERPEVEALVRGPGIPQDRALEMLDNLAGMDESERAEVYDLNRSDDSRDRSLAISKAANKPPMPDPAAGMLLRLGRLMGECANALDRHPEYAERIRAMRAEITTMQDNLYNVRTA